MEERMHLGGWFTIALVGLAASFPARAVEPACPLPLEQCVTRYQHLRERPWLGFEVRVDSATGARCIVEVVAEGPADRAGVKSGDLLQTLGGVDPQSWFAGRLGQDGWREGERVAITVRRGGHDETLTLQLGRIPETQVAAWLGRHVLEAHLAYMEEGQPHAGW
jgi:predicted metalloprotease with PDZ domain